MISLSVGDVGLCVDGVHRRRWLCPPDAERQNVGIHLFGRSGVAAGAKDVAARWQITFGVLDFTGAARGVQECTSTLWPSVSRLWVLTM
jgi:hypothetical protein